MPHQRQRGADAVVGQLQLRAQRAQQALTKMTLR
jgi:hypothetical protein